MFEDRRINEHQVRYFQPPVILFKKTYAYTRPEY